MHYSLFFIGLDHSGRQVVTFIGKLLPVSQVDLEKVPNSFCYVHVHV